MKNFNYNEKYRFIAKPGEWYKAGTDVEVEDGTCLWDSADCNSQGEITFDQLLERQDFISGLFRGTHVIDSEIDAANRHGKIGDEVEDGELCMLQEFEIVKR